MIDYEKSAELNGMEVDNLKVYFEKYPQSNKIIITICDNCGKKRNVKFQDYHDLCGSCSSIITQLPPKPKFVFEFDRFIHDTGIDRIITIEKMGYDPLMLSYGSGRKVWAICNSCGDGRWVKFQGYHDLCNDCSKNTPEYRRIQSETSTEQFSTKEARDVTSEAIKQFHIDNPNAGAENSARQIQWHKDHPEAAEGQSIKLKNSDAFKAFVKKITGGHDIINHHWLYDDADLSKYTMPMTRSEHTRMHNYMREDGYEVPHINSREDDNGLWGYH